MKVLALAADQGGCAHYRIKEPARVAKDIGVDITVGTDIAVSAEQDLKTGLTTVTEIDSDVDLIVIQRPLDNAFTSMIRQARRQGIATIVELDDDFDHIHPSNIAYKGMHSSPVHGPKWVHAAAQEADLVTVSTPALERYARHGRSEILRNCVPESVFDLTPSYERSGDGKMRVGWTGTVQTHPTDLQETKGHVAQVLLQNDLSLHIVGDGVAVLRTLGLPSNTDMTATGWVDIDRYYSEIGNMDFGIVPLDLTPFNQAKSALKGLEMAALGVPFVATATREYQRLNIHGVGKLANSAGEWRKHIQRWIDRPTERLTNAKQYRETVYNEMTYERNAQSWISAWEKAIDYRKFQR